MSLEKQLQLVTAALDNEKSHGKTLTEELQTKTQRAASYQGELEELKRQLVLVSKKAEENANHVKILATSCNESKGIIATKEKVCSYAGEYKLIEVLSLSWRGS